MKERLAYFDNLKGVLIILVVVGHVVMPVAEAPHMFAMRSVYFIYMFHMPLFIFVSGLFCKSSFRNGVFRSDLVLFYFALSILLYTSLRFEMTFFGSYSFNPFNIGGISWYLFALAVYISAVPLLSRIRPFVAILIAVVIALMAGFYEVSDTLSATRIIVFMPFFLAGYYLNPQAIMDVLNLLSYKRRLVLVRLLGGVLS